MNELSKRRIEFLGCPVDCLTSGELLAELKAGILAQAPPRVIQFVNANKVAMVRSDPWMGELLERADYVLADGQPMLPLAAMLGQRIPERIDGIGLMQKLLRLADREGFSVYLLGARQEIVEECVRRIGVDFPGAKVAGYCNGYFNEREIPAIAAAVRAAKPDFLFLGMGSPMKERLADIWKEELGARVIQGVGGSFDVMAGMVTRAPCWMQRCGIEWFYRVLQEPRRMFWRYVKTNGSCLWVFSNAFVTRWVLPGGQVRKDRLPMEPRMDANGREWNVESK
jgi:N-acetylglucosaminyldiphosphoundecaprenol N-acetyl-beta-D-mannosaminyltransferase